jgi:hypothetical protein
VSRGGFLLDTNAVSELRRKTPAPQVLAWFDQVDDQLLHFMLMTGTGDIDLGPSFHIDDDLDLEEPRARRGTV